MAGILGKTRENAGDPLGLKILGDAKENLENLGTLRVPLGLEINGKPRKNLESISWPGNPGKTKENVENMGTLGVPLGLGILRKRGKIWETPEVWKM